MNTKPDKFYSAPEQVTLPDGKVLWFSNQYRYNSNGIAYVHQTHWYRFEAFAERWHVNRRMVADAKLRGQPRHAPKLHSRHTGLIRAAG